MTGDIETKILGIPLDNGAEHLCSNLAFDAPCPVCRKPGRRTDWAFEGIEEHHQFVCSDPSCPRARDPWLVITFNAAVAKKVCPVCGIPYIKRVPDAHDEGTFLHRVRREPGNPSVLQVEKACIRTRGEDLRIGG